MPQSGGGKSFKNIYSKCLFGKCKYKKQTWLVNEPTICYI